MFEINYPIMFGHGTTIVTSYYYPTFKTGLMIAIIDSKKKFEKTGQQISDKEFREAYNGILKELYFDKPETMEKFINQLQNCLDQWKGEQK